MLIIPDKSGSTIQPLVVGAGDKLRQLVVLMTFANKFLEMTSNKIICYSFLKGE